MCSQEIEQEVKFFVMDLGRVEARLQQEGARLIQPRTFELNLRLDTPAGELGQEKKILRLRQDLTARLTFKGPSKLVDGVNTRQEIEFEIGDFSAAHRLLNALGFQVREIYEKYRAVYALIPSGKKVDKLLVMLDEIPMGSFVEIEGHGGDAIRSVAGLLGLDWQAGLNKNYLELFRDLRDRQGWSFRDLTFENFHDYQITAAEIGIPLADETHITHGRQE